jgi:hypothetical protein
MNQPEYRAGWDGPKAARFLLSQTDFVAWRSNSGEPPSWIAKDGRESQMMDDDDDRWLAIWKLLEGRGTITRGELYNEFRDAIF